MLATLKKIFFTVLALVSGTAFLFFAIINREVVTVSLSPYPVVVEMRLFILIGVLILVGILLGWIVASFECRRRYLLQKSTKERLAALENEIAALRAQQQLPGHSPAHGRQE